MAGNPIVFFRGYVKIDGVDFSEKISEITLGFGTTSAACPPTPEGSEQSIPAGKNATLTLKGIQEFETLDAKLWEMYTDSKTVAFEIAAITADPGTAGNPKWSGNIWLESYTPISGTAGSTEAMSIPITVKITGNVTRTP